MKSAHQGDRAMIARLMQVRSRRVAQAQHYTPDHMILALREDWSRFATFVARVRFECRHFLFRLYGIAPRITKEK